MVRSAPLGGSQKRSPQGLEDYGEFNTSFSGTDIVATITPIKGRPVVVGEIQTISYSIHRQMTPVHALGHINPKGITRGPRTIAGTIIFTVFDRHVLKRVMEGYDNLSEWSFTNPQMSEMRQNMRSDELPPFDINISFLNEYGQSATLNLYGIHILDEGQTMSIEDMMTENVMQYIAMDIELMTNT